MENHWGSLKERENMLVIFTDEQIMSPEKICPGCLLANSDGLPRWYQSKLSCGKCVGQLPDSGSPIYECHMGFKIANLK